MDNKEQPFRENKINIPDCADCRKQRQLAITCLGPLGYSAKCKKHQPNLNDLQK